jgi:hypothetical protein
VAIALGLGVDDEATDAFVFAYRAQPPEGRRRLADAVARDLDRAGHDPGRALAALFLAEDDPAVLEHLWKRLSRPAEAPASFACAAGDDTEGGVCLGLEGSVEAACRGDARHPAHIVAWRGERVELAIEQVGSRAEAADRLAAFAGKSDAREAPVPWAVDEAAERVWRHLRSGGALPAGAERFAPLFSA